MVKSFFRPLLRLQWKLTFSYTLITTTTLVLLTLVGMIAGSEAAAANFSQLVTNALQLHASELIPYLSVEPPDRAGIERWLQQPQNLTAQVVLSTFPRATYDVTLDGFVVVVNQQEVVVASHGSDSASPGTLLEQHLPRQARAVLRAALEGQTDEHRLVVSLANRTAIAAYPLLGPYGRIEGALVAQTTSVSQPVLLFKAFSVALLLAVPVALLAALFGTIFGFFTARGFSRRFKHLSFAVEAWGQGNFAVVTKDASGDEIGQLARRLNAMAEQLQALLDTRQKLAILEERNRLARDLHDSVKQQVFAISMLVNSAKGMLRSDLDRVQTYLDETDASVQHIQHELTSLVQALRPAVLEGKGFVTAVRELASQWSRQSGMVIQVRIQGAFSPMPMIAESLFRLVQEALSNAARHSQATSVEITLACEQDTCRLRIDDNGQGFDLAATQGRGVGLLSMQERMRLLGGTLLVESAPGKGTHITACCSHLSPGA
ncbi:MAG TPA: ATP-binding protein [Ktedonobacteraceae bacterium]|nr:ATP-binding protein [Ktedonobacteraceae bacterium]